MHIFSQETKYSEFLWKNLGMPFRAHNWIFFSFTCVAGHCSLGTSLHPGGAFGTEAKCTSSFLAPPLISIFASSFNWQVWEMGLTGVEKVENYLKGSLKEP